MKITAMLITYNEQDYIKFCLESLIDCVDHIMILDGGSTDKTKEIINEFQITFPDVAVTLITDETRDDYSYIRNKVLEQVQGLYGLDTWVLWIDGDEVLAHPDGSLVMKEDLIKRIGQNSADTFDIFTFHFMYNYFTIDGRNNGVHFSKDRLFKLQNVKINNTEEKPIKFVRPMHETLDWGIKEVVRKPLANIVRNEAGHPIRQENDPIIFHFGHCKGMESLRRRYRQCMSIPFFTPAFKDFKDVNEYCSKHDIFKGTRPLIRYDGKLPFWMGLW